MAFQIIRNDITRVKADAIVNSANPMPICGGSTEACIYEAAGYEELLAVRKKIGAMQIGDVAVTPAFQLSAKYLIHTVGPLWNDGKSGELLALKMCYQKVLQKAFELECQSIAFPLLCSGVYRFPKDKALEVANAAFCDFLKDHEMEITLVVYDDKSFEVSSELFNEVESYLNEHWERSSCLDEEIEDCQLYFGCEQSNRCECVAFKDSDVDSLLEKEEDTFQEKLFHLIQQKKLDDVDVYKRANLDRKHFSKIRSHVDYKPTKKTVLALALAMKLNKEETVDLLSRAEYGLSPASRFDTIVSFFIEHQSYDIWQINDVLFKHGMPTLGT